MHSSNASLVKPLCTIVTAIIECDVTTNYMYGLKNKSSSRQLGALPRSLGLPLRWHLALLHQFQQMPHCSQAS